MQGHEDFCDVATGAVVFKEHDVSSLPRLYALKGPSRGLDRIVRSMQVSLQKNNRIGEKTHGKIPYKR